MEKEYIHVIDLDGTELEVELISILEKEDNKYLIYSKGEKQKSGNLIIYITKLRIKDGMYYLENITDDDEWGRIKSLFSKIIN